MSLQDVIAVVLVALVPMNVIVAAYLARLSLTHSDLRTLRSRALMQIVLTGVSAIFGYFGLVDLIGLPLTQDEFTILLTLAGIAVSVPGLNWFLTYWTGRLA